MSGKIAKYKKVGVGAWAAKALYDETVTALLLDEFTDVQQFVDAFPEICQNYGGTAASRKLEKAANLLTNNAYHKLASKYLELAENLREKPLAPSCLDLRLIQNAYVTEDLIYNRVTSISHLTGISSNYFLGFTGELLGIPGFAAAYTAVTDAFISLEDDYRRQVLFDRKLPSLLGRN